MSTQKRILCLWLPNWPIQRMVVDQPELKYQRLVLFRQDSRRGQWIAAASPLAQRDGVRIDMPLSESKALLAKAANKNRGSQTKVKTNSRQDLGPLMLPHDPTADLLALQKLADELDCFSPIVGLQQETSQPDCIFLEVTGVATLFGGEWELAHAVHQFCHRQGYLSRIAIAATIRLAQAIVQHASHNFPWWRPSGPSTADTDLSSSNIAIIPADQMAAAYQVLPLATLQLQPWVNDTLHQLGIQRIEQLLRIPRPDLSARFGPQIHLRIDQLTGQIADPIVARQPTPEFHAQQLLEYPSSHQPTIEVILERLIQSLCQRLAARQQGALQWTIRLYGQQRLPLKWQVNLFQPTATSEHVMQLVGMQLEQTLQMQQAAAGRAKRHSSQTTLRCHGQPWEVNEVSVTVTSFVLLTQRQRQLFDEKPGEDRPSLARLINCLSSRLGGQQVVYPTLISTAQPECAYRLQPLVNPFSRDPGRHVNRSQPQHANSHRLARPLKLFHPPLPLATIGLARVGGNDSKNTSGPPASLVHANTRYGIVRSWGPERIETGWWQGPITRRDYWRVETDSHQQFWIYRDLKQRGWFLHGEF